ncbi:MULTISPECIES: LysM peptidoglycan-binding domain-containing protein [Aliivibrio]|uniref:LysM domain-containing protein n=1 Tax=Aliivibrio finisterrensis TaxID=511998 RepID=A0A4Q5KTT5_9GAMM|nr:MULTISPECIES: LysM domain-containing protein [Aliivibrio]MDD9177627.1 LysM domain-containing protein [Aliivibrio sp. A6]RYU51239.1 LysM domain-containing protein [Aliivibrio finisterrensis]RYU54436.1 LysM domain-containing protein [Aliivibrio finisterrensis]RYU59505.1 LysM domain-containing protein [Aliivibrio finisterrensis]RYU65482.1 LysM domain-containing protein [Aliivibrio finisterrensis]
MSQSYIVQSGDTLLKIAIDNDVPFTTLLELNPKYQPNPDLIHVGDSIRLPEEVEDEEVEQDYLIEPVKPRPVSDTCTLMSSPECEAKEVHDILFVTGVHKTDFYCVDEKALKFIKEEVSELNKLIQGYVDLVNAVPDAESATKEQIATHARKRQAWLEAANYAGAIFLSESSLDRQRKRNEAIQIKKQGNENWEALQTQIKELENTKLFVKKYDENSLYIDNLSVGTLKREALERIDTDLGRLSQQQLAMVQQSAEKAQSSPSPIKPNNQSVKLNNIKGKSTAKRHVIEVFSVLDNRYMYIRADFFEREYAHWRQVPDRTNTRQALIDNNKKGLMQAVAKDIAADIKSDIKSGPLKKQIAEWKADGGYWLESKKEYDLWGEGDNSKIAVSHEAQLVRWGANAAASLDKTGMAIGGSAAIALAEASAKIEGFLPYKGGYAAKLTYTDANKNTATYAFGCFRLKGEIQISAFVGAMVSGDASAKILLPEVGEGSVGALYSPNVGLATSNTGGEVGLKVDGFAGGQVGGKVTGSAEWKAPPTTNVKEKEKVQIDFQQLAEVSAEGNIAGGLGAGVDFRLRLTPDGFYFACSGRFVFGAGGSGSFASLIKLDQLWELAKVILQGLQWVGYRLLENIDERAYEYLVRTSYLTFASDVVKDPAEALKQGVMLGQEVINFVWNERDATLQRQKEAEMLSQRIISEEVFSGVPADQLLPEVVGMMLNTLVEDFFLRREEAQETAICYLLKKTTYSWRKFEEILSRMNDFGAREAGYEKLFANLKRINTVLDGEQQREFNGWVYRLAKAKKQSEIPSMPFTPKTEIG